MALAAGYSEGYEESTIGILHDEGSHFRVEPLVIGAPMLNNPRNYDFPHDLSWHSQDFGELKAGASVKHEFEFSNIGNTTLEITDVKVSCGCTTAGKGDRRVEPGKKGVIPIEYRSSTSGGPVTSAA